MNSDQKIIIYSIVVILFFALIGREIYLYNCVENYKKTLNEYHEREITALDKSMNKDTDNCISKNASYQLANLCIAKLKIHYQQEKDKKDRHLQETLNLSYLALRHTVIDEAKKSKDVNYILSKAGVSTDDFWNVGKIIQAKVDEQDGVMSVEEVRSIASNYFKDPAVQDLYTIDEKSKIVVDMNGKDVPLREALYMNHTKTSNGIIYDVE